VVLLPVFSGKRSGLASRVIGFGFTILSSLEEKDCELGSEGENATSGDARQSKRARELTGRGFISDVSLKVQSNGRRHDERCS
jgi:hypothetical protein